MKSPVLTRLQNQDSSYIPLAVRTWLDLAGWAGGLSRREGDTSREGTSLAKGTEFIHQPTMGIILHLIQMITRLRPLTAPYTGKVC